MRVLRAMVVLVPMLALGGWRPVNTIATPVSEVLLVDAGVIVEASSSADGGLMAWKSDGGLLNTLNGSFVGGGYYGNCLVGLNLMGTVQASTGCGLGTPLPVGVTWRNFRVLSSLPWAVAVGGSSSVNDSLYAGPGANAGWAALGFPASISSSRSFQTAHIGTVDYLALNSGIGVRLSVDAGAPSPGSVAGTSGWRDAAPFPLAGQTALLGVTNAGVLALIRDYRLPTNFTPSLPAGLTCRFAGISGTLAMVTTTTGEVLSPLPDPTRPLEIWVVRPTPTPFVERMSCLDDRYCAGANDAGVVWYWANEVGPEVEVIAPQVDAGQTIRLVADAGDGDGDPIFVTWRVGDAGLPAVAGVQDGTAIDFTVPPGFCSPTVLAVTVMDGLPEHNRTIQVPVTVIDRGEFSTSASSPPAYAGGPPVTLRAFVDGGCASANFSWSTTDGGTGTGPSFVWTPPAVECSSDGGQIAITATATWPSGAPSTTQNTQVIAVAPWGIPAAPLFASPGSQRSGSMEEWLSSGPEHVCSASSGFPGTTLIWTYDAGATRIVEVDGGLRIEAPRCARFPTRVTGSAWREVAGELLGRRSAPGTLVVDIAPDAPRFDANTQFTISVEGDGGVLFGTLRVDAGCLAEREAFANVRVLINGALVTEGGFPITDGGWSLPVPGGCSGGTYEVIAELHEDAGFSGATAMGGPITLGSSPARVGSFLADRVDVVCGSGARAQLKLIPKDGTCGASDLTWRVLSGPPLDFVAGQGDKVELQSSALDFSSVGQQVVFEWVADAGRGNLDQDTRTIELGVQSFLEVSVKAHPPLRKEEDAVSFEVIVKNTTDCAVDGLSLSLPLSGGTTLPGSVLIDGVHVSARSTDQGLVLEGVSVPASGKTTIQVGARARLLFAPTIEPVASLGPYVVSTLVKEDTPGTGCGCAEFDSSAFFALVLLVGARRRKTA